MVDKPILQDLHSALCELKTSVLARTHKPDWGICAHVARSKHIINPVREYLLETYVRRWPLRSYSESYPVPSVDFPGMEPSERYKMARQSNTLWDMNTEYGRLRMALLDFLIEEIQWDLDSLENLPQEKAYA